MEELKGESIHNTALKLASEMKNLKIYDTLYETVQKIAASPEVDKDNMKETLEEAIKSKGLEVEIRNMIFHLVRTSAKQDPKSSEKNFTDDNFSFLLRAGTQWDRRVRKSLIAMCTEIKVPIQGEKRSTSDVEEVSQKWEELSNFVVDVSQYRPVYAPKDLLEVLLTLKGSCQTDDENTPKWEFSHIRLPVKTLDELRQHYDDLLKNDTISDFNTHCERVLEYKHAPLCQQILKKGQTPTTYRGALWAFTLDSNIDVYKSLHWNDLKTEFLNNDLIVDKLIFKDINMTASNDDQYFIFEDILYQVMFCFSRDHEIFDMIQKDITKSQIKQSDSPPCGVIPFHGFCMFAAPFCYLYDCPQRIYFTFRAFYVRYCHRLTIINTHSQGIVSICLLFEKLLQTYESQLWSHLRDLEIQPLRIVFKWIMRAFSGYLLPDQLLILWDLIIGFDSVEILSLLSVIILSFRKESIMQVSNLNDIEAIVADLSSIQVLPLIQLTLMKR